MFSERIGRLEESLTMAITQKARELKSQGKDILGFSAGEPDFDTPQVIKDAAIAAINSGFTKYTAVAGIPELLETIQAKLKRENNLTYKTNQIVVSNGAKQSLFNLFAILLNKGDEVVIPTPTWVSYPDMVGYYGGVSVFVDTKEENSFKMTADELKSAITPKTKLLILNSPSNPTGAVYTKEEYLALGEVLKDTNIIVFSDEMYEKLVYDKEFVSIAALSDDLFNRTITINGLSKSVAMTGWRMGYFATANIKIAQEVNKLQSQSTSNINSITQKAAIKALDGSADADIAKMRDVFKQRRDIACEMLNKIDGLSVIKPDGAFYLYVSCEAIEKDSMKFCLDLLEIGGIATVPGCGFQKDGFFRMSFATDTESIKKGIERIEKFIKENYKK